MEQNTYRQRSIELFYHTPLEIYVQEFKSASSSPLMGEARWG